MYVCLEDKLLNGVGTLKNREKPTDTFTERLSSGIDAVRLFYGYMGGNGLRNTFWMD